MSRLGLALNVKKTQLFPLKQGINFLGFKFRVTETGKIIKTLKKENVARERRRLRKFKKLVDKGVLSRDHVDKCYTAWKAHASKGNTNKLIRSMDKYYENLWKEGEGIVPTQNN